MGFIVIVMICVFALLYWEHTTYVRSYRKKIQQESDRLIKEYEEDHSFIYRDHVLDCYNFQVGLESMTK